MPDNAYSWNATVNILQGGYKDEWHGAEPAGTAWQAGKDSGSHTALYYYADSNAQNADGSWGDNDNSSQILIWVTDKWSAKADSDNNVIITLSTTIDKIQRGKILGNPNKTITNGRDIVLRRYAGGANLWSVNNDPINIERTLATNLNLGTETITLKPGASSTRSSIYILNHTSGVSWDTPGSTDEMEAGVTFRNNLPADYRPGATWDGLGWGSNNRPLGNCAVYNGSTYTECRTDEGGVGTNNPPFGYDNGFKNQFKIKDQ